MTCTIPATTLNGSPYLLAWGSSIFAKVAASNVYGLSAFSAAGNGAIIVTVPDAPVALANNPAVTSSVRIGIVWQAGS